MSTLLPPSFYARDALTVARELLGAEISRGEVRLRITEVEAYRWPHDTANHCRMGHTSRNAPMWGPPGHAYVYLCYGVHSLLNLVTGAQGHGAAVLIRAAEPLAGHQIIDRRRGGKTGPDSLAGPGKVGAALDLDPSWSGHALFEGGGLEVRSGAPVPAILAGPRVGINYASREHIEAPWRLASANTPWVSHRRTLRAVTSS